MSAPPGKVLLATDGSKDAYLATRAAADVCEGTGADLHVVHVWHSVPTARLRAFMRAQLKRLALGSRAVGRMRLGSVSTKILHATGGPVLVCPPPRSET